ncbi:hypothetical protein CGCF413_v011939 [Colletotrichum fructicola]|nr:hypothetical protein CGCF413_v011939 [Colletotrichum fructicola]
MNVKGHLTRCLKTTKFSALVTFKPLLYISPAILLTIWATRLETTFSVAILYSTWTLAPLGVIFQVAAPKTFTIRAAGF